VHTFFTSWFLSLRFSGNDFQSCDIAYAIAFEKKISSDRDTKAKNAIIGEKKIFNKKPI
jgi:hypothetical protein